ncbi:hypothetical protein [Paenibacillus tianjinensis]|uniref:Uncharacterized protein n=1 Tax=Paenibacillus tianjinensis TaxID=2810347 RepID=A0ABX7LN34_9BACL|nr:hypothetical protein [Paenibacillus tianjinensis]QSF47267.1 hypothetical protein JRJ22_12260 [Paenibacillus tianjinensis]
MMFRINVACIWIAAVILLLGGCTAAQDSGDGPEAALILANPNDVRHFLADEAIANGDIYLEDNKVHINVVGLGREVAERFAGKFTPTSYVLHNVTYTAGELESAYTQLSDRELFSQLNLYGLWVDVKRNKIWISVPDDSLASARKVLEQQIEPGMLSYEVRELGEPHVTGTIVQLEADPVKRILILEPGKEEPTYWFSLNQRSELYNAQGQKAAWKDLKQGQQVHLWSTGMVEDSLPAQATLRRLELITK